MRRDGVRAGHELLIWADIEPSNADAHLLAEELAGTRFSGSRLADGFMELTITSVAKMPQTCVAAALERVRKVRPRLWAGSGTYQQTLSSLRPGCLIVLLDQSESMAERFGSGQLGQGSRKCDLAAMVMNRYLYELVEHNRQGAQVFAEDVHRRHDPPRPRSGHGRISDEC